MKVFPLFCRFLAFIVFLPQLVFCQPVYNITSYGALADSTTNNSKFIQKAIDDCSGKGGGTVFIPSGRFLTGSITLKSNVNLYLDAGAVLLGSPAVSDYTSIGMATEQRDNGLIVGVDARNVTISGRGTIDGNGKSYIKQEPHQGFDFDRKYIRQKEKYMSYEHSPALPPDGPYAMRTRPGVLILLINCDNVLLKDFTISDAPNWCLHLGGCRYVNIQALNILNSLFIPNADGIDASNCQFVNINNCNIVAGDDGIAISPCADGYCSRPSENYTISNCNIVSRSSGIRVGYGVNDIRDLAFDNITIQSNRGIGIFVRQNQHIENIVFSNMIIKTRFMDGPWWGNGDPVQISVVPMTADTAIGQIKNIRFSAIRMESENGITIYSSSAGHIKNIFFNEVQLNLEKGPLTDAFGGNFDLRPAHLPSLKIFKHDIAGIYACHAEGISIAGFTLQWGDSLPSFYTHGVWLEKCSNIDIKNYKGGPVPNSVKSKAVMITPF